MDGFKYTEDGYGKDFRETIAAVWPEGMPALEEGLWSAMDDDQRELAAARVALLTVHGSGSEWRELLSAARLSRDGFYKLLRRWRGSPSLLSLVPDLKRQGPRKSRVGVDREARKVAERLVRAHPEWSRARLVTETTRALDRPVGPAEVRRMVDDERLAQERARYGGGEGLGRRVVVGTTVVTYRRRRPVGGEVTFSAYAGFIVDLATGCILGHAASSDMVDARASATRAAASRVLALDQAEGAAAEPEFEVHLSEDAMTAMRFVLRSNSLPWLIEALPDEGRTTASRLVELLGPRLGLLELRPRAAADPQEGDTGAVEVIAGLLDRAVDEREAGRHLPPAAVPLDRLSDGLKAIAG